MDLANETLDFDILEKKKGTPRHLVPARGWYLLVSLPVMSAQEIMQPQGKLIV